MEAQLPTKEDFARLVSTNGTYAVQKAFWELSTPKERKKYPPIFTLKQNDFYDKEQDKMLPSAYNVYMDSVDEYDAATKLAPNMKVWDIMKVPAWFMEGDLPHGHQGLKVWREHMQARDASLAMKALHKKVKQGDTTAAKALLAESKKKAPVGRKSKKTPADKATSSRILEFKKKQGK